MTSYQDEGNADETQMTRKRNADETQMTPTKEGKEVKNDKEGEELYTSAAPAGPENEEEFYLTSKRKKLKGKRLETFNIFWDKV